MVAITDMAWATKDLADKDSAAVLDSAVVLDQANRLLQRTPTRLAAVSRTFSSRSRWIIETNPNSLPIQIKAWAASEVAKVDRALTPTLRHRIRTSDVKL